MSMDNYHHMAANQFGQNVMFRPPGFQYPFHSSMNSAYFPGPGDRVGPHTLWQGMMPPQSVDHHYPRRRSSNAAATITRPTSRSPSPTVEAVSPAPRQRSPSPVHQRVRDNPEVVTQRSTSGVSSSRKRAVSTSSSSSSSSSEPSISGDVPEDDPLVQEEVAPFSFSLSSAYKAVYATLPEDLCTPLPPTPQPSFTSLGEEALWRELPNPPPSKADTLTLPLSKVVSRVFEDMEEHNQSSTDANWFVSSKTVKGLNPSTVYRAPRRDSPSDLNLDAVPGLDGDCKRAHITKPAPSSSVVVPLSTLERWEARERQVVGAASQLDLFCATLAKLSSKPELDLDSFRQVLMAACRSTAFMCSLSASTTAELLRARRHFVLDGTSKFLLEPSKQRLLTAPLTSPDLFGGIVSEVLAVDKEDQLHASVARRPAPPLSKQQPGKKRKSSQPLPAAKKQKFSGPPPPPKGGNRGRRQSGPGPRQPSMAP